MVETVRVQLVDQRMVVGQRQRRADPDADVFDGRLIRAVCRPYGWQMRWHESCKSIHGFRGYHGVSTLTDLVAARTNVDDSAANVLGALERLADHDQQNVEPQLIEKPALVVPQRDEPAAAALVRLVLPHRANVALEQRIVVAGAQLRCHADVIVQAPEVLHRIERGDAVLHLLPRLGPIVLQIPQRPLVVQRMLD